MWVYQLKSQNPHIANLGIYKVDDNFEDDFEREMVQKITVILIENGYSRITYDYNQENSRKFDASLNVLYIILKIRRA